MKKLLLLLFLGCFPKVASAQSPAENPGRIFTAEELRADLRALLTNYEQIHPNLYAYVGKKEIEQQVQNIEKKLRPMTRLEFARLVVPFSAAFRDGHTGLNYPMEEWNAYTQTSRLLPIGVSVEQERLFVKVDFSENPIPAGTEIISLNGMPAPALLAKLKESASGELEHFRLNRVSDNFRRLLWSVTGMEAPYTLVLKEANGQRRTVEIKGNPVSELIPALRAYQLKVAGSRQDYALSLRPEQSTAILHVNAMNNPDKFKSFLDSAFTVIRDRKIANLLLDFRQNGGGNSGLGDELLRYLTDKPIRQVERVEIKISPIVRERGMVTASAGDDGQRLSYTQEAKKPAPLRDSTLFFRGKVFLLTSHYTFSSANMFATAFKCYRIGTIVGQETGGVTIAYGDLIDFALPNTGLQAFCSCKVFVHPCAEPKLQGVRPDVEVAQSPQDTQAGRDTVLEYLFSRLKSETVSRSRP